MWAMHRCLCTPARDDGVVRVDDDRHDILADAVYDDVKIGLGSRSPMPTLDLHDPLGTNRGAVAPESTDRIGLSPQ